MTARAAAERIVGNTSGYTEDSVAVARAYLALTTPAENAAEVARGIVDDWMVAMEATGFTEQDIESLTVPIAAALTRYGDAEREACAKVADAESASWSVAKRIAAAIRSRKP